MENKLAFKVERLVNRETTDLGALIVRRQFERMGITPDEFGPEHLDEFLKLLKDAMVLFVGRKKAEEVVDKIRAACS